jgi:hypothetical protein
MSQDIADARTHGLWVRAFVMCGWVRVVCRWAVVAGGVDGELAQELAGRGVDDADVQVLDE